ncbi:hypothetical protein [Chitinophaga sancti]|uniref:Uncharacterized protein n=1 Tax=Chitinophaga sancti TaxID=1004 RepID=A0A1K1MX27_9BACT|nr:hypothetical protein [Chitinophaga sancti]WQD62980.1 hypothetical protein U0033_01135 [Chitinophaga sancti]WQG91395.1 hypothetical protein SR876_07780 [Chitinophaga sancti]SFW26542.1 hypothetical protein SAMN05661012_00881 [Chitinophaga sancti]
MDRLRFFLKLAFICNLCFALAEVAQYIDFNGQFSELLKFVLPMGLIVAFPLNLITLVIAVVMLLRHKVRLVELPAYVFVLNLLVLVFQFYFLF